MKRIYPLQPLQSSINFCSKISSRSIGLYCLALFLVTLLYISYSMEWYFFLFGIVEVCGFFLAAKTLMKKWNTFAVWNSKQYERKLFATGVIIRLVYVLFIYWFYNLMNGQPFEFSSADSKEYVELAAWWAELYRDGTLWSTISTMIQDKGLGDLGYPLALLIPTIILGDAVLVTRMCQAFIGAHTLVLIYRLSRVNFDDDTARVAAIFCMLNPVLVVYTGMSLKETLMVWILVLFIQKGDELIRSRNFKAINIGVIIGLGLLLFMFRTVLAMVAFLAIGFAIVMTSNKLLGTGKKILIGLIMLGMVLLAASNRIISEIQTITNADVRGQMETSKEYRYGEKKAGGTGNSFAKYASTAVFAPLIFTIPFPTMVDVGSQQDMRLIHGGNFVKNVTSGLVIFAMFMLLLSGDWRQHTLPLAIMLGYLVMLSFTQFAQSLRFHIPAMPFEMMFAAYGLTHLNAKHKKWYMFWIAICLVFCVGWNWFKLAGRGMA